MFINRDMKRKLRTRNRKPENRFRLFFFRNVRKNGQTLLDTMLGVGILSLLLVVMLCLVEKSLEATTMLERQHTKMQQRLGFIDTLRKTFRVMPGDVQMISRRVSTTSGQQQQIVFANAPSVFAWGNPDELIHSSVILGTPQQLGGAVTLAIKRDPPPDMDIDPNAPPPNYINLLPQEGSSDDKAPWLTLLDNISWAQWRFFDPRSVTWLDDWADTGSRPSLVELQIQYLDEDQEVRYVFWVPPISTAPPPKFTSTAATNSTNNVNRGGATTTPPTRP